LKKSAPVVVIADRPRTIAKVICAFTAVLRTMKISVQGNATAWAMHRFTHSCRSASTGLSNAP
jgi:hypothetical protein